MVSESSLSNEAAKHLEGQPGPDEITAPHRLRGNTRTCDSAGFLEGLKQI